MRGFEGHGEHGRVKVGEGRGGFSPDVEAEAGLEIHEDIDHAAYGEETASAVVLLSRP